MSVRSKHKIHNNNFVNSWPSQDHIVPAVSVHNAFKRWKQGDAQALNNCSIRVNPGTVYGLLGPSGCGKTTLLNSIVGLTRLNSGRVYVFGREPGDRDSGIPGPMVGLMPQELALYSVFTVRESLSYFGTLTGMTHSEIEKRTDFLLQFLNLDKADQKVGKLSGGQQRRVSLAVALINTPPLLILDEPTVGLDPVLRETIWNHLLTLCKTENTTAIIATHYIEEASRAHRVGLMRDGRILQEASPRTLMTACGQNSLEAVFLLICKDNKESTHQNNSPTKEEDVLSQEKTTKGQMKKKRSLSLVSNGIQRNLTQEGVHHRREDYCIRDAFIDLLLLEMQSKEIVASSDEQSSATETNGKYLLKQHQKQQKQFPNPVFNLSFSSSSKEGMCKQSIGPASSLWTHTKVKKKRARFSTAALKALIRKNFVTIYRNIFLLAFQLIIPPLQVALFAITIRNPRNLPFAIYNAEVSTPSICDLPNSTTKYYSCSFLQSLDPGMVKGLWSNSSEEALQLVKSNQAWGMLVIPENFTEFFIDRVVSGLDVSEEVIQGSTLQVRLDMTVQILAAVIQEEFLKAYQYFLSFLAPENAHSTPIVFGKPIYGHEGTVFAEFIAPGMLVYIGYFMAMNLTALCLVQEKKQGLLKRSIVSGTTSMELLLGHLITQILIMVVQNTLSIAFLLGIFSIPSQGSLLLVVTLVLISGFCGMTFGLLVSSCTNEETTAGILFVGASFPTLFLTGFVWPREAMDPWIHTLSSALPQTMGIEGLRNVMSRGAGITDLGVQIAFAGQITWSIVHLACSWLILVLTK